MKSNKKSLVVLVVLLCVIAAGGWIVLRDGALTRVQLLINASPFLVLLGVWIFMFSRGITFRIGRF